MRWTIATIVVLALAAGLWWLEQVRQSDLHRSVEAPSPSQPAPEPRYPLPVADSEPSEPSAAETEAIPPATREQFSPEPPVALPELAQSDTLALEVLTALAGREFVAQWAKTEFVIPRTVALVNSLDGAAPALRIRPIRAPDSEPVTTPADRDGIRDWTGANARRYDPFVEVLEATPPERAAEVYARHYPLFQAAWEELGETEAYFNDRLVDIIDHLLATPDAPLPFAVRPYEGRLVFVDDALEERSWGQKALLRLGPEHASRVKSWLEQFRQALRVTGPQAR